MKTVAGKKGRSKRVAAAPEEQPVDSEIRRAAERIGVPPEYWAEQERKRRLSEETKLTFTLKELCDAVGYEVNPESFAADALDRIGQQIEGEAFNKEPDDEWWHRMCSIAERANFAALVVRKLQETAVAS